VTRQSSGRHLGRRGPHPYDLLLSSATGCGNGGSCGLLRCLAAPESVKRTTRGDERRWRGGRLSHQRGRVGRRGRQAEPSGSSPRSTPMDASAVNLEDEPAVSVSWRRRRTCAQCEGRPQAAPLASSADRLVNLCGRGVDGPRRRTPGCRRSSDVPGDVWLCRSPVTPTQPYAS
jgi:hypothetical protein